MTDLRAGDPELADSGPEWLPSPAMTRMEPFTTNRSALLPCLRPAGGVPMFVSTSVPAALQPLLDGVRALPECCEWTDVTAADRADWLAGLRELVDAAEATFTTVLYAFDAAGDGTALHGAGSTPSWLRGALGMAPGDAASRVRLARNTDDLLAVPLRALRAGTITYDQLRAIDQGVTRLPQWAQRDSVEVLTALAKRTDVSAVRVAARHLQSVLDPDGSNAEADQQFDRRFLNLCPLLDGMTVVDGLLDPEAAALLTAALAAFLVPVDVDDRRSAAQRRADGLVELARTACDHEALPQIGGARPHLDVICPVSTLIGPGAAPVQGPPSDGMGEEVARSGPRDWKPYLSATGTLSMTAVLPGVPAVFQQTPCGASPLSDQALQRLACDAEVARVLVSGRSEPLDLGRAVRLFTAAQRKALALRDGGCRFPGCHRPSAHTDAHHRVPWTRGGRSDLLNGLLLCRVHHRLVHEGGWSISETDPRVGANARLMFVGPQGQHLPSDPRGP
ncbi:MAG: DUF222 domain-containing protein [Actinomycetes bacterium]